MFAVQARDMVRNNVAVILIVRPLEVVAEAAFAGEIVLRIIGRYFGIDILSSTDRCCKGGNRLGTKEKCLRIVRLVDRTVPV